MTEKAKGIQSCFNGSYEAGRIGVLDGVRALAVAGVVWYHFWQQSWVALEFGSISLDCFERCGYLLVDLMLLLSGFCLYLPYARAAHTGDCLPDTWTFYKKRVARIMPSYYACMLICTFGFALPLHEWSSLKYALRDLIPHLTFTQNFFKAATYGTKLDGALWTVAVEMQFYLFFPLLAKAFARKPWLTYGLMVLIGFSAICCSVHWFDALAEHYTKSMVVNNTFSFLPVYANGMLGAHLYIGMEGKSRKLKEEIPATVGVLLCVVCFYYLCCLRVNQGENAHWQLEWRYPLSLFFLLFLFCVICSARPMRKVFDNKIMAFGAVISYNLYIWHQYLAVKLKELHIPYYEGSTPPNVTGDSVWQAKYLLLCIVLSFVIACAATYLIEKPVAKLILKKQKWRCTSSN